MQVIISVRKSVRFVSLAIALAGMLFLFASAGNVANAKPLSATFGGHCYTFVNTYVTWSAARTAAAATPSADALCAGSTGYLAVINSAAENIFVASLGTTSWLGGTLVGSNWQWATVPGSPTFCTETAPGVCPAQPGWYTLWGLGEPPNTPNRSLCITAIGFWATNLSSNTQPYIIEYDPAPVSAPAPREVPEGDTLLLLGGGIGGLGVWLRYQWSKRRAK